MPALAVDFNELLSAADVVDQIFFRIELAAQLVRVGDLSLSAKQHIAFVWCELAQ